MALELSKRFKHVTGLDPEDGMIAAGLQPESGNKIRYAKGTAEDLPAVGVKDNSIDLAVAGEAAHYFTHENSWPQLARALKPKGSIAWIVSSADQPTTRNVKLTVKGYGRIGFPGYPEANKIMSQLMDHTLSPYWSEPGWSISEGLYDRIPFPVEPKPASGLVDKLPDLEGDGHALNTEINEPKPTGDPEGDWDPSSALRCKSGTTAGKWHLKEHWTLAQVEKCLRSWSSIKRYEDKNPDDRGGDKPDIVSRTIAELKPIIGEEFNVAWPLVVQFIRRK